MGTCHRPAGQQQKNDCDDAVNSAGLVTSESN